MKVLDRAKLLWVQVNLRIQNLTIRIVQAIIFKSSASPDRILVFRTGSIGDNICAMPSLVAIRNHFPNAKISLLTDAGQQNLLSLNNLLSGKYFDGVVDYSRLGFKAAARLVRAGRYDLVIELPQNIVTLAYEVRNMLFFRLAGIPSGFGWQVTTCFTFLRTQEKHSRFLSETDNLLQILGREGIKVPPVATYPLFLEDRDVEAVNGYFRKLPSEFLRRKIVALVPGAKRPQNRYPIQRFVDMAEWLVTKGYSVLVVGGKEDETRGATLEEINGVLSLCGRLTPMQSAAALSRCFITISNDTGPMHLSYAVGTPVIGLFSSRDFQEKWFPPSGKNIALRNYSVPCSLCFSETCADNVCMQGISLEEVKNAFLQLEAKLK